MSYQVNFTDSANKDPIIVEDNTIDASTGIIFPGRNSTNYGPQIAENFLHILENFASPTAPDPAVQGQLWYDTSSGVNQLKINVDGTPNGWQSASGFKKGNAEPTTSGSFPGDLWVNTDTQQLYLYSGSGWVLVGPRFSSGAKTGAEPEIIIDAFNQTHSIVSQYCAGERVAIISKDQFTPKVTIPGFNIINPGVNMSNLYPMVFGTAEIALNLYVPGGPTTGIPAANFLRGDVTSTTAFPINIRNSGGLTVGSTGQVSLSVESNTGVVYNKAGGSLDFRIFRNNAPASILKIDSAAKVGINNSTPTVALDVVGDAQVSATLKVGSDDDSGTVTTGSIVTSGGLGVAKSVTVGGDINLDGILRIETSILPNDDNIQSIGSLSSRFKEIYSVKHYGDFYGNYYGSNGGNATFNGNVTGSAAKLASPTTFTIEGDVSSNTISFDGQTGGLAKVITATISDSFVSSKNAVSSLTEVDELLISRGSVLKKISKANFWNSIHRTPIGTVVAYMGQTAPAGWLFCDGSEVLQTEFQELYNVIGYTFGASSNLQGIPGQTFKLPDMRGRFALGLDNMNNGITVPSATNPNVSISTGGGSANRVTDPRASELGIGAGSEDKTIVIDNLPDHEHDMRSAEGNQYYAYRNIAGTPTDTGAVSGEGSTDTNLGQYLASSGGVAAATLGTPLDVMNPFLAVNYIIYAGTDV